MSGQTWEIKNDNGLLCQINNGAHVVALVNTGNSIKEANIIAAAPALLKALERIAQYPATASDEMSIESAREIARDAILCAKLLPPLSKQEGIAYE